MPRELIAPRGDKRYVRRKQGKFTKLQDNVGRALAADRRKKAKRTAKKARATKAIKSAASRLAKSATASQGAHRARAIF